MAVITVGASGADYTTINAAIAAASGATTIRMLANFAHDGTKISVTKSDLSFESISGNPADCLIEVSADTRVFDCSNLLTGLSFTGLTIKMSKGGSQRRDCIMGLRCTMTVSDCVLETSIAGSTAYGISYPGVNSVIQRCHFKLNGTSGFGVNSSLSTSTGVTVDSCLFDNCGRECLTATAGSISARNCTFYQPWGAHSTTKGVNLSTANSSIYNCVIFGGAGGVGVDQGLYIGNNATNTAKNIISFGSYTTDFNIGASVVTANLYDQAAVAADGNPVFVNVGTDFHPDTSGLAYEGGDASFAPSTDIEGESWNSPPSIGCYETPAAGGGGGGGAVSNSRAGFLPSPFTLTP